MCRDSFSKISFPLAFSFLNCIVLSLLVEKLFLETLFSRWVLMDLLLFPIDCPFLNVFSRGWSRHHPLTPGRSCGVPWSADLAIPTAWCFFLSFNSFLKSIFQVFCSPKKPGEKRAPLPRGLSNYPESLPLLRRPSCRPRVTGRHPWRPEC
jgi:hypothetical protein